MSSKPGCLTRYPSGEQYRLYSLFAFPRHTVSAGILHEVISDRVQTQTYRLLSFNDQPVQLVELTDGGLSLQQTVSIVAKFL